LRYDSAVPAGGLRPESLGEALCLLRRRAGITRNALAAAAGLSGAALSTYENDASAPSAAALRRLTRALADCLGCDVAELWGQLGGLLDDHVRPRAFRAGAQGLVDELSSTVTDD
jgi:transcriptional regulator with XRE-family HTH domain